MIYRKIKFGSKYQANIYIDNNGTLEGEERYIRNLVKEKPLVDLWTGKYRTWLIKHLRGHMYGSNPIETGNFDTEKTLKIIESTLKKCVNVLPPPKPINVFVFRSFNRFILEKLYGSSGFAPMKNFLFLYIVPSSDLSAFLPMTVAHEYNHAVRFNYAEWINLSDSLISEGLAQKFAEHIAGEHELMARVLTEKRALDIFKKLSNKQLSSRGSEIYNELFFEDKEYPLWAGYSIGYHLVNLFLKTNKKFTWKDITKVKSKDIIHGTTY